MLKIKQSNQKKTKKNEKNREKRKKRADGLLGREQLARAPTSNPHIVKYDKVSDKL
jgi:hypothetical protein